jgi:hypothetical protein
MSEQKENWEQYAITPDEPKEDRDWEKYSVGGKERVKSSNLTGYALLGGGALGAGALGKLAVDPFIQSAQLNRQASPIKKALNIPKKTPVDQLPKIVADKIKEPAGEIALNIKQEVPKWKNQVYTNYGNKIKEFEGMIKDRGVNFSTANFNTMLSGTANSLESNGFVKEANNVRKQIVKSKGGGLSEFLDFKEALKRVQVLKKQNPSVARNINENWGNFLSKDPVMSSFPEIKTGLDKINSEYVTFKNVENTISSMGRKGGEFNTRGVQNYIERSLKGNSTDAFRAMDYLSKGSEIVPPMKGIAEKVPLMKGYSDFMKLSNDLALKSDALKAPIARRTALARIGIYAGALGKLGGAFSMYPLASQGLGYQADPAQFMAEQYGVGGERQRYQSGQMTEEEKIRLGLTL